MAEKKKTAAELTVEEKLQNLYQLQTILSKIDAIKILRGDSPLEVRDLEDEVEGLMIRIAKYKEEISQLNIEIIARKKTKEEAKALVERYKEQLNNVRNNREYDTLSKEVEFQTLEIELCDKKIAETMTILEEKTAKLDLSKETLADRNAYLKVKKTELDGILEETRNEEEELREKAKLLDKKIESRLLTAFTRIRKNSRNGLGLVYIERDACGGCFNQIPPQRQLDIRLRKKIIVCEYCGRILIDPELAGFEIVQEVVEAPKKRATRKKPTEESPEA